MESWLIPAAPVTVVEEIKKSRFITMLAHTDGVEAAKAFVESVRAEHPDARHHCVAWVAGAPDDSQQLGFSDDGEPAGTAGKPMLAQLMGSGVGEITAVVVRYYGGILLGTGGLVKAYGGGVNQALEEKLGSNEERMERMRQTIEGGLEKISAENRQQLEQMRQTVDEKLNATVDQRLEASFSVVTKRLEQVTASLSAVQSLAGSIDELGRMVSGAKPLGVIGEAQLGAILSQMLAPSQYAEHAPVRPNGEPVADYVVVMPGQSGQNTVYLPIDASLPKREYHELCVAQENGTRADIESARGLLESAVRMHARRMSEKLIAPPYTTDYAVLFLQSEGLFAEVLRIPGLSERVQQESRMVIAGPTTLAALISSLQLGFKSLAIEQRTQEVMNLLGAIRTDFAGFAALLGRTQKKLRQATEELDHAQQHTQTIAKRLSDVNGLPEDEAKKLLGLMDDEDPDDNWD